MSRRFASSLAALCLAVAGLAGSEVKAADYAPRVVSCGDHCPPRVRYETVTCYETRQVPYTVCETLYDECGRPYYVEVTRYRTVRVAVTKRVAVYY